MKIKPRSKSLFALESVAMTDIVMNLFIFFFISFSLLYTFNPKKESQISIDLPQGQSKAQASEMKTIVVQINSTNEFFIDAQKKTLEDLQKLFQQKSREDITLIVKADKNSSVQSLVSVLDHAKVAGIKKLGVASLAKASKTV